MTKKLKPFLIPIAVLIIFFAIVTFISFTKFNVTNPIAVADGLYKVIFTDKQYVEIQAYPKVIIAKSGVSLQSYMKSKGFTENTEEQLGALHVFEHDDVQQYVFQSVNKYFAKWHWNE